VSYSLSSHLLDRQAGDLYPLRLVFVLVEQAWLGSDQKQVVRQREERMEAVAVGLVVQKRVC